jgi:hypothetical protein
MKKTRENELLSCEMKKRLVIRRRNALWFLLLVTTTLSIPMNNDRLGKYAKVGIGNMNNDKGQRLIGTH